VFKQGCGVYCYFVVFVFVFLRESYRCSIWYLLEYI